ncbi:MAG: hypothetical protein JXJ20_03960 [Anaerolineae bacterium]|nr:hypothetical protein [Anaerolineae bacterium]
MSESQVFQLERLYYGTLADPESRVPAAPDLIASTPNITPAQVTECLRVAQLRPPGHDEITDDMPGSLALFQGRSTNFVLAKAQHNDAGYPQVLYIMLPVNVLRWLGGNVLAFRPLAMMDMPSFATTRRNLRPFELRDPAPPSPEEQVDALFDLLVYCHDSFKNIEGLLAGLIQGWPLAIVNSPPSLDQRLRFIQGLLSFLPIPARLSITFATHIHDPETSPAQIKFLSQRASPDRHLVYDWGDGRLLTTPPDDGYSHYMLAQFRLDPSLVVEQTDQLARTTVWRASHKENLGRALGWVSRRAAIDQAVLEGQPADREMVAAILREDPTLPDDLRQAYVRHLLAFVLALEEPDFADVIPVVAVTSSNVANAVAHQLQTAIENGQARMVYALLERWYTTIPEAAALDWQPIIQNAARQYLIDLLDQNQIQAAIDFIHYTKSAHPALRISEAMPDLVALAQFPARSHPELAETLFLLSVETLPAGELHRLLSDAQFVRQLPETTQAALAYLQPEPQSSVPPHVLDQGARAFGDGYRMLVLARFVEWAMYLHRPELIDTAALQSLLVMAQSPKAGRFEALIEHVVEDFSRISVIQVLEPPGARILVQLMLQIGRYDQAIALLEFYQNEVFRPERLLEFTRLAGETFLMTPLSGEDLSEALTYLEGSQIRPEPRALIYCGALINRDWADDQDYAARRLTSMTFNDNNLARVIGFDNTLNLLDFHARQRSALNTLRVGAALVDSTLHMDNKGAVYLARMWPSITWNTEVAEAALELLRRYLRGVQLDQVPTLLAYFHDELGPEIEQMLHATYLMRLAMNGSGLMRFAHDVHTAASLFVDIATTYHAKKDLPLKHRLRRDLDTMTGGLSENERKQVAENTYNITQQVYELGQERSRRRRHQPIEDMLIQGIIAPQAGVDLLRFIGGHFAHQAVVPLDLERGAMAHVFGNRSAAMFLRETNAITRLLEGLQSAFEQRHNLNITAEALTAELDSLWSTLSLYHQRRIHNQFAQDCQQLAEVIGIMADRAHSRILSDRGRGRQLVTGQRQPKTALEAMRWVNGYFARRHRRRLRL